MRNRRERQRTEQEYRLKSQGCKAKVFSPSLAKLDAPIKEDRQLVPIISQEVASKTVPRVVVSKPNRTLVFFAYSLGITGLGVNAWFTYNQGSTVVDKVLMSSLGFILEAIAFKLPQQMSSLCRQRRWGGFGIASIIYLPLLGFAIYNSLGFASQNFQETKTVRSERITPAVTDAMLKRDTFTASRDAECRKRGPLCRQFEQDVISAMDAVEKAREKVSALADPQIASAAKLVAWVSMNRFHPSADDFAMLRLLLLTLLPQLGGLVLMAASRS
jgi:hypothetical protein